MWFIYTNSPVAVTITGSCSSNQPILAPAKTGNQWVDFLPPYNTLSTVTDRNGNGCLDTITLPPYGYRVLVETVSAPPRLAPIVVSVSPSHDKRILRNSTSGGLTIPLILTFSSSTLTCATITQSVAINSFSGPAAAVDVSSVICVTLENQPSSYGIPQAQLSWTANLINVPDGVTQVTVSTSLGILAASKTLFRVGGVENVIVFPKTANFSTNLLTSSGGGFQINHKATGADQFRYTTQFGKKWSVWAPYEAVTFVPSNAFSDSDSAGRLSIQVQYYSKICGSAAHVVVGELKTGGLQPVQIWEYSRFPRIYLFGEFNQFGKDQGIPSLMSFIGSGNWEINVIWNFPTNVTFDKWGDGYYTYGDVDKDGVLDRLPPNAQDYNVVVLPLPPFGYTGWKVTVNDFTHRYYLSPQGSMTVATVYFVVLFLALPLSGIDFINNSASSCMAFLEVFLRDHLERQGSGPDRSGI